MGCSSCSNDGGVPKGCKSNGNCGTDSCNHKLTVFDWLSNMNLPNGQAPFDWVELRFKNGRKEFYKNVNNLSLQAGEVVAVEAHPGHDIGTVGLVGELVKLQMRKKNFKATEENTKKVYRKASQRDIDRWVEAQEKEAETMFKSREIASRLNLDMKISDVEYQGDGAKAVFYYTANARVDFRLLIRELAGSFNTRVEMKQIGARQEAARLGGIGSCGRELCCSTWLTDFRSVNTSAARYQQLSLNPIKLAGQCGKLKCCLNYELDSYLEAIKDFPELGLKLQSEKGNAFTCKQDIFKRTVWFAYMDSPATWIPVSVDRVNEIVAMNKAGEKPEAIEVAELELVEAKPSFSTDDSQGSLTRFDSKKGNTSKRRKKKRPAAQKDGAPKTAAKVDVKKSAKAEVKSEVKADAKPAAKSRRRPARKPRPKSDQQKSDQKPTQNAAPKVPQKPKGDAQQKPKPKPRPKPRPRPRPKPDGDNQTKK